MEENNTAYRPLCLATVHNLCRDNWNILSKQMWDQLDATISDFIVNKLFLNMFRASLRPSSGCQTAFSLHMLICPVVTAVMLESWLASCVHCVE